MGMYVEAASYGQIASAMTGILPEYRSDHNRDFILSLLSMTHGVGMIIGPLIMGILYDLDVALNCMHSSNPLRLLCLCDLIDPLYHPLETELVVVPQSDEVLDDVPFLYLVLRGDVVLVADIIPIPEHNISILMARTLPT